MIAADICCVGPSMQLPLVPGIQVHVSMPPACSMPEHAHQHGHQSQLSCLQWGAPQHLVRGSRLLSQEVQHPKLDQMVTQPMGQGRVKRGGPALCPKQLKPAPGMQEVMTTAVFNEDIYNNNDR